MLGRVYAMRGNGICFFTSHKDGRKVLQAGFKGARANRFDRNGMVRGVIRVFAVHFFQAPSQLGPVFGREFVIRGVELAGRPIVQYEGGFPMQPVRGPVGCHLAAVAPNRSDFHSSKCLPDVLTFGDVAIAKSKTVRSVATTLRGMGGIC